MPSFNKVILIGHVTRDPQLKYLPSQTAVCEWGLAMNRKWKTEGGEAREEVCFVDCAAFGKAAETINQYVTKGKPLMVEGRLKLDSWEDKNGGGKRTKLSVIVDQFQFIGGRDDGDERQDDRPAPQSKPYPSSRPAPGRPAPQNPIGDDPVFAQDDIPF